MKTLTTSVIAGIVTLCIGLWAVASFSIGGLKDSVVGLREDGVKLREALDRNATAVQTVERDGVSRADALNKTLSDPIQKLQLDFVKLGDKLDLMSHRLDAASDKFDIRLNAVADKFDSRLNAVFTQLEATTKSMEAISLRLEKSQAQIIPASETDLKQISATIAESLKSLKAAGVLDDQRIIIVPVMIGRSSTPPR